MCLIKRFASTLSANREEGKTIRMEPEVTLWFEEMSSENSRSKFQVSGGFGVPRFHRRIALPEHHQRGPGSGRSRREARFSDISSAAQEPIWLDRKSTRLNSSHRCISYAVFCLKKKR